MGYKLSENMFQRILGEALQVLGVPWEVSLGVVQVLGSPWGSVKVSRDSWAVPGGPGRVLGVPGGWAHGVP